MSAGRADGYTSLMIDGSKLPLDENIALARRVVEMASGMSSRPCVEAELGKLGGKEDDLEVKPVRIFTQIQARRPASSRERGSTLLS